MINIRTIQHYMYCPRRLDCLKLRMLGLKMFRLCWRILFTKTYIRANTNSKSNNKVVLSSVTLYNDELDLYGVADCIEFCKNKDGVPIDGLDGKYTVRLVEYKPTQPKDGSIRETDAIQVFAQKLCADYIWKCNSEGTYIMPIQENV